MDMLVKSESLTSVAGAIREKGGTSEQLVFPDGFATAIMAIQSGGVSPQLIITATAGSTITAVNGEDAVTGVVGAEGTLTLDLPAFGTWAITATLDDQEASASVYIKQEYPVSLSYSTTFTVNGGHGETITITENGEIIETVPLDDTGTGTIVLNGVGGKTLVFTGGLSGYECTVNVGIEEAMTVNLYPDGALYWYGREFVDIVDNQFITSYGSSTVQYNSNSIRVSSGANSVARFIHPADRMYLDKDVWTEFKANITIETSFHRNFIAVSTAKTGGSYWETAANMDCTTSGVGTLSLASLENGNYYIGMLFGSNSDSPPAGSVLIHAMWLE